MLNKSQKDLIELQLEELQNFILRTKYIMEWKRGQGEQSRKNGSQIEYLTVLRTWEPRIKVVVEIGGDGAFRWTPLKDAWIAA